MSNRPEQYWPGLPEERNNFSYLKYQALGGCLNQDFFESSLVFLDSGQQLRKREKSYCLSCRHYAGLAGLSPNLDQEIVYAYLRAMMPPARREENGKNGSPWLLSDQALLAEVFLLTEDADSYRQLVASFPNIFMKKDKRRAA